jgi:hypothetical protein
MSLEESVAHVCGDADVLIQTCPHVGPARSSAHLGRFDRRVLFD